MFSKICIVVEVWDVSVVNSQYGSGPLQPHESYEGFVAITSHVMSVVDASFSPDGTALATASSDGYVKFFQVNILCVNHSSNNHNFAI